MKWIVVVAVIGVVLIVLLAKQLGQLSKPAALQYLKQGAKVIDVRTPEEFQSGHLAEAISIPLGSLEREIPRQAPYKQQVLLLHCQSGVRSGMAARTLKRLGYAKVYNLGSFGRAEEILRDSR